jgi:hypothetical protein
VRTGRMRSIFGVRNKPQRSCAFSVPSRPTSLKAELRLRLFTHSKALRADPPELSVRYFASDSSGGSFLFARLTRA